MSQIREIEMGNRTIRVRSDGRVSVNYIKNNGFRNWTGGSKTRSGHMNLGVTVNGEKKRLYVHRIVAQAYCEGYKDGLEVNHIDGNPSNNLPENLEWVTHAVNLRSFNKPTVGTSKYRGVFWDKKCRKWRAQVKHNYKNIHLGTFSREADAALAFNEKAKALGWPDQCLNHT